MIGIRRAISLFTCLQRLWAAPARLGDLRSEAEQARARQVFVEAPVQGTGRSSAHCITNERAFAKESGTWRQPGG